MKAAAMWEYLPGVKEGDIHDFTMNRDLTLDMITENESGTKTTFYKDKTVKGTPAIVTIRDPKTNKVARIEGVLIKEAEGIYVIAKEFVRSPIKTTKEAVSDVIKGAEEVATETVETVKRFDTEKTLGFTKKQLLVLIVTTLIVIKILK